MDRKKIKKRERSQNYLKEEKDNLLIIVEDYKYIIENKKTDALSATEKWKAWTEIADKFNCSEKTGKRTGLQLKLLYEGLKKKAKILKANEAQVCKTGEGLPNTQFSETNERISAILDTQIYSHDNIYDSNADVHADNRELPTNLAEAIVQLPDGVLPVDVIIGSTEPSSSCSTSIPAAATKSPSRASPSISTKIDVKTKFMERVKQKENTVMSNNSYAAQLLSMKKERHNKIMEYLELVLKKEAIELELKQIELKKRKENL